jgi:hypothetical protein
MSGTIGRGSDANRMVSEILCGIFFLSGVAALMFETLWFRQAGLPFGNGVLANPVRNIQSLNEIQTLSSLRFPVLLSMGGPELPDADRILGEVEPQAASRSNETLFILGMGALADRDFVRAEKYFAQEQQQGRLPYLAYYRVYALSLAGRMDDARKAARDNGDVFSGPAALDFTVWLRETFGF